MFACRTTRRFVQNASRSVFSGTDTIILIVQTSPSCTACTDIICTKHHRRDSSEQTVSSSQRTGWAFIFHRPRKTQRKLRETEDLKTWVRVQSSRKKQIQSRWWKSNNDKNTCVVLQGVGSNRILPPLNYIQTRFVGGTTTILNKWLVHAFSVHTWERNESKCLWWVRA